MTQNTIENKRKFFALYFGQNVWASNPINGDVHVMTETLLSWAKTWDQAVLVLKCLSAITDDEVLEVAKIIFKPGKHRKYQTIENGRSFIKRLQSTDSHTVSGCWYQVIRVSDYLRSRGYLLPYLDLSPEQLIEYEWAKYPEVK